MNAVSWRMECSRCGRSHSSIFGCPRLVAASVEGRCSITAFAYTLLQFFSCFTLARVSSLSFESSHTGEITLSVQLKTPAFTVATACRTTRNAACERATAPCACAFVDRLASKLTKPTVYFARHDNLCHDSESGQLDVSHCICALEPRGGFGTLPGPRGYVAHTNVCGRSSLALSLSLSLFSLSLCLSLSLSLSASLLLVWPDSELARRHTSTHCICRNLYTVRIESTNSEGASSTLLPGESQVSDVWISLCFCFPSVSVCSLSLSLSLSLLL